MIKGNYKFPAWENTEIINPTITVNGEVGSSVVDNQPQQYAFVDIQITTDTFKGNYRLAANVPPIDWSMESIQIWVGEQIAKYKIQ